MSEAEKRYSDLEAEVAELTVPSVDYALAFRHTSQAADHIWGARIVLGRLLNAGERVQTAYDAAVRASEAVDRAMARLPKASLDAGRRH